MVRKPYQKGGGSQRKEIPTAFQQLLSESGGWWPSLSSLSLKVIRSVATTKLEDPFSTEEVFVALLELNGDKVPGLDGFSIAFWHFCWDFVWEEVMGFFREFYEHNKFVRSPNSTFLVLILRNENAMDLKDFRPISLVGSIYKILVKVLANRPKRVVGQVVSVTQMLLWREDKSWMQL